MLIELYVSNLPPDYTESDVAQLFDIEGAVQNVILLTNQRTNLPRHAATVEFETNERYWMVLRRLNQKIVEGYQIFASPKEPTQNLRIPPQILKKQSKDLAEYLRETDLKPRVQIHRMIRLCGVDFVQALVDETNRLEKEGGLMLPDGTRRRTKGGVFFHLARNNVSHKILKPIFFAPMPEQPEAAPPPPPPPPAPKKTAAELLDELRRSYRQSQQKMVQLQSSGAPTEQVAEATREMVKTKKQIDELLKRFPNLR